VKVKKVTQFIPQPVGGSSCGGHIKTGQKRYALAAQNAIILIPLPDDPLQRLAELVGDVHFNREVKKKAKEYIHPQVG